MKSDRASGATVGKGSLDDASGQFACSGGTRPATAKNYGAGNPFAAGRKALGVGISTPSGTLNSH